MPKPLPARDGEPVADPATLEVIGTIHYSTRHRRWLTCQINPPIASAPIYRDADEAADALRKAVK